MRASFLLLAFAAVLATSSCVQADDRPSGISHIGHLQCGGASLTASSVYLDIPDQDRQTFSQRITLMRPENRTPISLPHDGQPIRQPFLENTAVLDAAVTGWACLQATGGKAYVYLLYTCVESVLRPACEGDRREWARLFDTQGKALNAGFPHDGPRTPELMKKLGLGRYVDGSVQLQDVDG
jgi:hypothetical protein